jgi:tetratricopeptide (TPR) repeat protein
MGNHYLQLGMAAEAAAMFTQAHCQLGNLYVRQGRLHEAKAQYERTLGLYPKFSPARKSLSRVRERLGE